MLGCLSVHSYQDLERNSGYVPFNGLVSGLSSPSWTSEIKAIVYDPKNCITASDSELDMALETGPRYKVERMLWVEKAWMTEQRR